MLAIADASPAVTVRCPDQPVDADGNPHTVIGCGCTFTAVPDDEGLFDSPSCGTFFTLQAADDTGSTTP